MIKVKYFLTNILKSDIIQLEKVVIGFYNSISRSLKNVHILGGSWLHWHDDIQYIYFITFFYIQLFSILHSIAALYLSKKKKYCKVYCRPKVITIFSCRMFSSSYSHIINELDGSFICYIHSNFNGCFYRTDYSSKIYTKWCI